MKNLLNIFFLFILICIAGCKTSQKPQSAAVSPAQYTAKTEEKTEPAVQTPSSTPPPVIIIDNSPRTVQKESIPPVNINIQISQTATNPDSVFATLERTSCYGRCPTYKITIFNSGFVIYEGIRFTDKIGKYSTRITSGEMQLLLLKAKEIDYFNLADVYDSPVTDIPSTNTSLNTGGKKKSIKARSNVPVQLRDYEQFFDNLFTEKSWAPAAQH